MNTIYRTFWAYRNKVTNKLFGTVHVPAQGKKKGDVLISYITEPFTKAPWEDLSRFHTMYWECAEIARLFSKRGYAVDILQAGTASFKPKKNYTIFLYNETPVDTILKSIPQTTKKVFRILVPYWKAYNKAETERLDMLEKRRGVKLSTHRQVPSSMNAETADFLEGFGNKAIFDTFKHLNRPIHHTYISAVELYDFPETKDFSLAQKRFLWIGGGGAVLKGLDLVLEAFAQTPELTLHVCGPTGAEKDFCKEYEKELYQTKNILFHGRIDIASDEFKNILSECASVIYPSAGEGTSGSIVQAMHAGLIPIVTPEVGLDEGTGQIILENPSVESVRAAVLAFSSDTPENIQKRAKQVWSYARTRYTRENFSKTFEEFIENTLQLP